MIPAAYLLGKALYDRYTGLMAALLIAMAPMAISLWYVAKAARQYT